jgi:hypothetical protein
MVKAKLPESQFKGVYARHRGVRNVEKPYRNISGYVSDTR